jgi:hypothetical protein
LRYLRANGFSAKQLIFAGSLFASPQGSNSFGALQWRVGEISVQDWPDT